VLRGLLLWARAQVGPGFPIPVGLGGLSGEVAYIFVYHVLVGFVLLLSGLDGAACSPLVCADVLALLPGWFCVLYYICIRYTVYSVYRRYTAVPALQISLRNKP
jgi:hypothetical protein